MRGTDLTPEQIQSARQFALDRGHCASVDDAREIVMPFGDLIRLVAWYGAMRYQAGRDGINSLEKPGEVLTVRRAAPAPTEEEK